MQTMIARRRTESRPFLSLCGQPVPLAELRSTRIPRPVTQRAAPTDDHLADHVHDAALEGHPGFSAR